MKEHFQDIETWVFDLDNTLYPPEIRLFDQIEARMVAFVMEALGVDKREADRLRAHYWESHGTTLAGLMDNHDIDPRHFMIEVHDIDFSILPADPRLRARIDALPGRKIIYTNGSAPYAENVLQGRGLSGVFDAVYGVEDASWRPKPERTAFETVFGRDGFSTERAAMFEDEARNLEVPYQMGLRTVHVSPVPAHAPYIHHHTDDISGFLAQLVE